MALRALQRRFTPEEYLMLERKAERRSEYFDGQIFAMAGASRRHILITASLSRRLGNQLENRPCEVYPTDMRVRVRPTGLYTYPDIVIVCGGPQFDDKESDTLLNPTVLIEVLSPTTEAYDRGEKFSQYRRLTSLREYVLVAQDKVRVECYRRQGDFWVLSEVSDLDKALRLESIDCEVPLREIYERIDFSEEGEGLR